jgi:hypothetical protein
MIYTVDREIRPRHACHRAYTSRTKSSAGHGRPRQVLILRELGRCGCRDTSPVLTWQRPLVPKWSQAVYQDPRTTGKSQQVRAYFFGRADRI